MGWRDDKGQRVQRGGPERHSAVGKPLTRRECWSWYWKRWQQPESCCDGFWRNWKLSYIAGPRRVGLLSSPVVAGCCLKA